MFSVVSIRQSVILSTGGGEGPYVTITNDVFDLTISRPQIWGVPLRPAPPPQRTWDLTGQGPLQTPQFFGGGGFSNFFFSIFFSFFFLIFFPQNFFWDAPTPPPPRRSMRGRYASYWNAFLFIMSSPFSHHMPLSLRHLEHNHQDFPRVIYKLILCRISCDISDSNT